MKALIVDDEKQSRDLLRRFISDYSANIAVSEAADVKEAKSRIEEHQPDLIFLDVQLRSETGFDLLDQVNGTTAQIIFVTAHADYAIRAFKYSAVDYLVKPVDREELEKALGRAEQRTHLHEAQPNIAFLQSEIRKKSAISDKLVIPMVDGFQIVPITDILYCKANGNYTEIFLTENMRITSSYTLGHFDEILVQHDFFRIHRSSLVNLRQIKMYRKGEGGTIIMNNGHELDLARNSRESFLKLFKF